MAQLLRGHTVPSEALASVPSIHASQFTAAWDATLTTSGLHGNLVHLVGLNS